MNIRKFIEVYLYYHKRDFSQTSGLKSSQKKLNANLITYEFPHF